MWPSEKLSTFVQFLQASKAFAEEKAVSRTVTRKNGWPAGKFGKAHPRFGICSNWNQGDYLSLWTPSKI